MKEYYKDLAVIREQQQEGNRQHNAEVAKRRDALNRAKEVEAVNAADELNNRLEALKKFRIHKAPFNSSSNREKETQVTVSIAPPGPGSYNSINNTIMEGYIRTEIQKDKVKVGLS